MSQLLTTEFDGNRWLIFVSSKRRCDDLTRYLRTEGWPAMGLHGEKCQLEREWVLKEFRTGNTPIMLATDVAARGLGSLSMHCVSSQVYTFLTLRSFVLLEEAADTCWCCSTTSADAGAATP